MTLYHLEPHYDNVTQTLMTTNIGNVSNNTIQTYCLLIMFSNDKQKGIIWFYNTNRTNAQTVFYVHNSGRHQLLRLVVDSYGRVFLQVNDILYGFRMVRGFCA